MALSRTTSRLFNKAPTYTRPAPYAGPATPWGMSEQRKTMGLDGRQTPYADRLKAYYDYARPFVNPGNGFTMADVMQLNVPGTYPPGPDASRNLSQQNPMPSPTGFKERPYNGNYNGIVINQPDGQLNLGDPNNYKSGSGMRNFFGEMTSVSSSNPMMTQQPAMVGQAQRRLNVLSDTPVPAGSLQASGISQGNPMSAAVASMSNGYFSLPSSVSQGRTYGLNLPMDQAEQKNRVSNQNPMYAGMQARTGPDSVMGQQAAMIAQNEGAGNIRIPGSYGEMPTYVQKGQEPEVMLRPNGRGNNVSYIPPTDPVLNRQFNALKEFKPDAERGANRKAAREATKARLADSRFKMQVSKGLNPNSAKAKALFPDQVAKMNGKLTPTNPMAKAFEPGAPDTVENQKAREDARTVNVDNSLTLQSIGVTPDMSPYNFAATARPALRGDLSDQGYQDLFNHVKTYAPDKGQKFPEWPRGTSESWNELWSMPQDTPVAKIKEWAAREKAAQEREDAEALRNNGQALQYMGM